MSNDKVNEWYKEFYEETKNAPSVRNNEISGILGYIFLIIVADTILGIILLIFGD